MPQHCPLPQGPSLIPILLQLLEVCDGGNNHFLLYLLEVSIEVGTSFAVFSEFLRGYV